MQKLELWQFKEQLLGTIAKIRQGATERITDAKEDLQGVGRRMNITYKKARRTAKFTGKKIYKILLSSAEKFKDIFIKAEREKAANKIVKERVKEKSWLTRRLLDAFPDLQVKFKKDKEDK